MLINYDYFKISYGNKISQENDMQLVIKLLRHIIVEAPISDNRKLLLDMIDNGIVNNMISYFSTQNN